MTKRKTTVYIDEELLRAAKIAAIRRGKKDYEIFEEALRSYLGIEEILERTWARSDLEEDESQKLAYDELHRARRANRA